MSVLRVNGERGEVALRIGSTDLVIAAEIGGLAALSSSLECRSLADLYERLFAAEVKAVVEGVRCLAVRGDVDAAIGQLTLADFPAAKAAFETALLHHVQTGKPVRKRRGQSGAEEFSFRSWLRAAVSVLGWRPSGFWRATVTEFSEAVDGHAELHSIASDLPSAAEMEALLKRHG